MWLGSERNRLWRAVGIQDNSGRIFFSAFFHGSHFLYWSNDSAATYTATALPFTGLNECSISFGAEPSGDSELFMFCRTGQHHRAIVRWDLTNGTQPMPGPVTYPNGLIDPDCQGSIIRSGDALYISNPNSTTSRSNMTVKRSIDNGQSWNHGTLIWAGPSGYSQLVELSHSKIGLIFESGVRKSHEAIHFVEIDI